MLTISHNLFINQCTGKSVLSDRPGFTKPPVFPVTRSFSEFCEFCFTDAIQETWSTRLGLIVTRIFCDCSFYVAVDEVFNSNEKMQLEKGSVGSACNTHTKPWYPAVNTINGR